MLLIKQKIINNKIYIFLFLITFFIAFSSTYNPLNFRRMHVDSSIYITIAKGIIQGQLPYKDFVDNKGPLAYLISVPGIFLGGFTGIWITEILLLLISVLFAYKTALFFGNQLIALIGTIFSFIIFLVFFTVSAGTEEYSLPFLMISFYIFTKYFLINKKDVDFIELITLGICFSCAILIRFNMFPLWIGFCLVIFIESIKQRRFILLIKYLLGFCLGIFIIFIPVFLYLKLNGIFNEFINQAVYGGAARGFSGNGLEEFAKNFYIVINRGFSALPLFYGLFQVIKHFKKNYFTFYLSYTLSCLLMIFFLSFSSGGSHYNVVLVPFFIPAIVFMINIISLSFSDIKYKNIILILFFCFVFSEGIINFLYDFTKIFTNNSGIELKNAGKIIDSHTNSGDKIISLGFNGYVYPFTRREIASKYFYQGSGLNHIPGAREGFISDIVSGKPAIIVLFNGKDGISQIMHDWHDPIFIMINNEYHILSRENGFILYKRNN